MANEIQAPSGTQREHPLFSGEVPVTLMSGESPRYPSAPGGHEALKRDLDDLGAQYEETRGHYGVPERSLIVYGVPRETAASLGKKYGQEAVIHSQAGRPEFIYTNGENEGAHHASTGTHEFWPPDQQPDDYWTELPGEGFVRLNFDFDHVHRPAPGSAGVGGQPPPTGAGVSKSEVIRGLTSLGLVRHAATNLGLGMDDLVKKSEAPEGSDHLAEKKQLTVPEALRDLHQGLTQQIQEWERQCLDLRKAELQKKSPPGRKKEVEDLKAKGLPASEAFGIAWDQSKGRPVEKAAVTEGGMGAAPGAPIAQYGSGGLQMSEDERLERYAKGEQPMTKAMSPIIAARMAANKAKARSTVAEKPPAKPETTPAAEVAKVGAMAKAMSPIIAARMVANKAKARSAQPAEKPAPAPAPAPEVKKWEMPAGSSPDAPGPKVGVYPDDKPVKVVGSKEGGNDGSAVERGKMAKAAPAPGGIPAAPKAPAAGGAPKLPKLSAAPGGAPAGAPKLPKLPTPGKAPAGGAPKTPPLGAGQPNLKAEPELSKTSISPRNQAEQKAKLPHVRASAGGLMDNMLAGGSKPLAPGQPLAIQPVVSNPLKPVGVRSDVGGGGPKPMVPAGQKPVQTMAERVASRMPAGQPASALAAPPALARPGAAFPPPPSSKPVVHKGEPSPGKPEELEKEHLGFDKLKDKVAEEGARDPAAVAAAVGREKYGAKKMAAKAAAGRKKK